MSTFGGHTIRAVIDSVKAFCLQTSIHGFYHIAAPRRHWFERLLWACFMVISIWAVVDISMGQWQRYNENPTIVTLEKNFRVWSIHMPAVTACLQNRVDTKKLPSVIKSRWNVELGHQKYNYLNRFVTAIASSSLANLTLFEEFEDDPTLNVDFFSLAVDVMVDIHVKVSYGANRKANWTPVMTELGVCHTFNSVAIADVTIFNNSSYTEQGPITCQFETDQSCFIFLESDSVIDYYIHSPYDLVDYTEIHTTTYPSVTTTVAVSTTEIGVGPGVKALLPKRRNCLFTDEPTIVSRQVYSTHSCKQDCRRRLAIKLCGCQPFHYFYAKGVPICSVSGMRCLSTHHHRLLTLDAQRCSCSQNCVDAVFKEARDKSENMVGSSFGVRGSVRYKLTHPRERYVRYIVFHFQDLVGWYISFGGAAGLFLGASFISFVEIGYYLMERMFCFRATPQTTSLVKKSWDPYEVRIKELAAIIEEHFYRTEY